MQGFPQALQVNSIDLSGVKTKDMTAEINNRGFLVTLHPMIQQKPSESKGPEVDEDDDPIEMDGAVFLSEENLTEILAYLKAQGVVEGEVEDFNMDGESMILTDVTVKIDLGDIDCEVLAEELQKYDYTVLEADDPESKIRISYTGSIQDAALAEVLREKLDRYGAGRVIEYLERL
jgi:hypothetical protein